METSSKSIKNPKRFMAIAAGISIIVIGGALYTTNKATSFLSGHLANVKSEAFQENKAFICSEGNYGNLNAYIILKAKGWSEQDDYFQKGDRLIHKKYCALREEQS